MLYGKLRWRNLPIHIVLVAIGLVWIYPFIWMVSSALKTNLEFTIAGLSLIPQHPQWGNVAHAWREAHFSSYFYNSAVITVATVVLVAVLSGLTGYALGRVRFPGRAALVAAVTATMFIPKGYTIIPIYQIIKHLGLLNTLPGVVLAESSGAHVLFILLFMSYFAKIPRELEESAEMDGAGFIRTFVQIMLPLARPIVATVAIMQFIWTWNSFFVPLVFTLSKPELRTLAVGMFSFTGEHAIDYSGMAAAATISLIPVIMVFVLFQRFFIEGISGSVKG